MSTGTSTGRFEAVNAQPENRAGDNNFASGALSREAANAHSSFSPTDVASATQGLVNDQKLPPLQITWGQPLEDKTGANINGQMFGDKKSGIQEMQAIGDKTAAQREMQTTGDKAAGLRDALNSGDLGSAQKIMQDLGDKAINRLNTSDFSKEIKNSDLQALNKSLEEKDEKYDGETDSLAESIGRDGSLGNGPQETANRQALEKHMENGTLDEFVADINAKLANAGSPYRVSASQFKERMKYTEDAGSKSKVPDVQVRQNNRANITITNTTTGRSYTNRVAHDPKVPGYGKPQSDDFQF